MTMPTNLPEPSFTTDDHPHEECGIIGIFAPTEDVTSMVFYGLYALQHRGQEAAGIAVSDGQTIRLHKDVGLVAQVFTPAAMRPLRGSYAIGHVRYATTGASSLQNAQPFMLETRYGPIGVAHNGNLVNIDKLRGELMDKGVGMSASSDSEVIAQMLAGAKGRTFFERLKNAMMRWEGAYSLVLLTREGVYVARDPWGFRPLSVGLLPSGGHAAASESGALRTIGCVGIREVKPGEIIALSNNALRVEQALRPKKPTALCVFENIYFSRPDSYWDGLTVHQVRQNLGRAIARQAPVEADAVIPVPDSSTPAAIGYAAESGIPYNDGFIKNRYIGRTFIEPTDSLRKQGIRLKFNVIEENVRDKRLVVVDDSIVRGNTTGPLINMLREAGAKEVHIRITCPPLKHPCFMGVDMGTYEELIAHKLTVEQICKRVGADSLVFLKLSEMMKAIGRDEGYCKACFTGKYPVRIPYHEVKMGFDPENHEE